MPYLIELDNTYANQEFDVDIEGIENNIHCLLQTDDNNALLLSVYVNDELIGIPYLCCPNQPIIPYKYQVKKIGGNFSFRTAGNEYPNFENFGETCFFEFTTIEEIENV